MPKTRPFLMILSIILALFVVSGTALSAAVIPQSGAPAPAFTLKNQEGKDVSLSQFRGQWVVLYFYPKDFTSGCSLEAHNFQSDIQKYIEKNAVIVGVSADTVGSHKSFCTKEGLNFILLSDTQHAVSDAYGSLMTILGMTLSARNTFLIDPAGIIRKTYIKVDPAIHSDEVLKDLAQLEQPAHKTP